MLHLVQTRAGLQKCKNQIKKGDDVVYLGEGVLCGQSITNVTCFAIENDLKRFGAALPEGVGACDMNDVIELVTKHQSSVSWR